MDYLGTDMGLNIEDASIFVALELLQAPSVGEITRKGYVEGWKAAGYVFGRLRGHPPLRRSSTGLPGIPCTQSRAQQSGPSGVPARADFEAWE